MNDNVTIGSKRKRVLQPDGIFLYEGGNIPEESRSELRRIRVGPNVKDIPSRAFWGCINLVEVHLNDGLQFIGDFAFRDCTTLQQVTVPSSVTKLGKSVFWRCINLTEVQFKEGLQVIEEYAFWGCRALQHVTIPPSVIKLGGCAFWGCINLAEVQLKEGSLQFVGNDAFRGCTALQSVTVILLGGEMRINRGFLDRGLSSGEGALNRKSLNEMIGSGSAFLNCPLTAIKIPALSQRMARLPQGCRLSVEERVRDMRRLEVTQDGTILASFPVVGRSWSGIMMRDVTDMDIGDTDNQTAESLHEVLRLISFHELKESSIPIELAMWKSRIKEDRARADCRISVPDPAKTLIMEYCGFTDFLEPAIEGA